MSAKLSQNKKLELKKIENSSRSPSWVHPKPVLSYTRTPKNAFKAQKSKKNDLKIRSKSKVKIGEDIENKSCTTTWLYLKTVFETYLSCLTKYPFGEEKNSKRDQEFANKQKL